MLPTSRHMDTQTQSHFHSRALHFTAGDWRGKKTPTKQKAAVAQSWKNECYQSWYGFSLPLNFVVSHNEPSFTSLAKESGEWILRKGGIGNCSESCYFPKAFAGCRKTGEKGRRERQTCQQGVTGGNEGNTHSYSQTTANYSRTACVCSPPPFHSSAFMPSLLERITRHCLTTKVKPLSFMFFPTKDKQQ